MRHFLYGLATCLLAGALVGCGTTVELKLTGQSLTGNLRGDWRAIDHSKLRLAVVDLEASGTFRLDNQSNVQTLNSDESFAAKLSSLSDGSYQLVAYSDENASGKLEASDTVLGSSCHMYLLFVQAAGTYTFFVGMPQTLELQAGWSSLNTKVGRIPVQAETIRYFDIFPTGYCPAYEG